ncbi:MAG TPA: hypothetical protein ENI87_06055 [bacterium]|nr:hypothetical protein [bacterium]
MRALVALLLPLSLLAAQEGRRQDEPEVDFQKDVAPILVARCIECHGPEEQEGDLRLDAREFVFPEGEEDYWTVFPNEPEDSELLRRIGLGLDDDDVMPAKGEPLTKSQQALIERWIRQGAAWPQAADEWIAAELAAQVLPKITFELPDVDGAGAAAIAAAVKKLAGLGVVVQRVAADTEALEVNLSLLRDKVGDDELALLRPLAPVLVWLNASRTAITDAGARHLAALTQLRRLNVANTELSDRGFRALAGLARLEYLNAYGTSLGDEGLARLAELPRLAKVYAWQSKVTAAGVAALKDDLTKVQVDRGDYVAARLAAARAEIAARERRNQPINDKCPVSGKDVDPAHFVVHEGRRVAFCCSKCKARFEADPGKFVARLPKAGGQAKAKAK